jgi:hypothetical protein
MHNIFAGWETKHRSCWLMCHRRLFLACGEGELIRSPALPVRKSG